MNPRRAWIPPPSLGVPQLWWLADGVSRNCGCVQMWGLTSVVARKCHLLQMYKMAYPSQNSGRTLYSKSQTNNHIRNIKGTRHDDTNAQKHSIVKHDLHK